MNSVQVTVINALAELEAAGWKYEPRSDSEVSLKCPVHDDKSPSVGLNIKKNQWLCHAASCKAKGDIISLLAYIYKVERDAMILELQKRYELFDVKTINPVSIEQYHEKIWGSGPLLQGLRDRGVTDEDIRLARLGYHNGRIQIPIYDLQERIVNIRRYLPGGPAHNKMLNIPGYGKPRLYLPKQVVDYERIWILGGEIKALVARKFLNPNNIGATSITSGEGNKWPKELLEKFKDKVVYICFDIDLGGIKGAEDLAMQLQFYAREIWIIRLPLDTNKYKKGDINDFIGQEGAKAEDLLACQINARKWEPPVRIDDTVKGPLQKVSLNGSMKAELVGHDIEIEAIIMARDETPYLIPKDIGITCTRDQPNCPWCIVKSKEPDPDTNYVPMTISATSIGIADMVNAPVKHQQNALREALKIPACKTVEFHVKSHYSVNDVRLAPQLKIGSESTENSVLPALCLGHGLETNTPYVFKGKVYPSPKTQQAILILAEAKLAEDNLTSFAPKPNELVALKLFQPAEWTTESLKAKLDEIYNDLEANVTRIYRRRDLHLLIDLTYHSVLFFNMDGRIANGWVNSLVVGDSSQGKTETSTSLMRFYGLGERVECKNATIPGLLGGVQQLGNKRYFVTWGVIPIHDRRLVILEEVKGASTEIISKLTDMRSSGIAEVAKIEKRRAWARTRLLFISNPRSPRRLAAFNFGIEAIAELIGNLEDVRRFDVCMVTAADQIDAEEINRLTMHRPGVPPVYTAELCRQVVLWAWTRTTEQVIFEDDASKAIFEYSNALSKKFTEVMPILDRGTTRFKLARLAVALACRTFSANEDLTKVIVRKCHVDFCYEWLDKVYSEPTFGYKDFSDAQVQTHEVVDPGQVVKRLRMTKYPSDIVENLLSTSDITVGDIVDWLEADKEDAQAFLSFLVRKHAIYRSKRDYVKTPRFIDMLKALKGKMPEKSEVQPGEKM